MNFEVIQKRSDELYSAILEILDGADAYPTGRDLLAFIACDVAFEHGQALLLLLKSESPSSAAALLRIQFEALTRATWLAYAATDGQVAKLAADLTPEAQSAANSLPIFSEMMQSIVKHAPARVSGMLTEFKEMSWKVLNSFVHSGIHPLRRHADGYPRPLIIQLIENSNSLTVMTGMLAALLTDEPRYIEPMCKIQKPFADCLPPLIEHPASGTA